MDKKIFSFEYLDAYQEARKLVCEIYKLQRFFPSEERYALGDQIRRAAVSITSNVAEGCGRSSMKEKVHFIEIAYGSLLESFSQLQIAQDLGYLSSEEIDIMRKYFDKVARLLSGLKSSYEHSLPIAPKH